jgi:hypothetical protein
MSFDRGVVERTRAAHKAQFRRQSTQLVCYGANGRCNLFLGAAFVKNLKRWRRHLWRENDQNQPTERQIEQLINLLRESGKQPTEQPSNRKAGDKAASSLLSVRQSITAKTGDKAESYLQRNSEKATKRPTVTVKQSTKRHHLLRESDDATDRATNEVASSLERK